MSYIIVKFIGSLFRSYSYDLCDLEFPDHASAKRHELMLTLANTSDHISYRVYRKHSNDPKRYAIETQEEQWYG